MTEMYSSNSSHTSCSAMKDLTAGTNHTERVLELETPDGQPFKGVLLYENRKGDQVILTEDEKLIVYYRQQAKHFVREDEEDALPRDSGTA